MLKDFQGDSWGSIPPLRMSSLLPHDLCHGWSTSLWPPTEQSFGSSTFNILFKYFTAFSLIYLPEVFFKIIFNRLSFHLLFLTRHYFSVSFSYFYFHLQSDFSIFSYSFLSPMYWFLSFLNSDVWCPFQTLTEEKKKIIFFLFFSIFCFLTLLTLLLSTSSYRNENIYIYGQVAKDFCKVYLFPVFF